MTRSSRARLGLALVWFALAALGLVGTWYFNLSFFAAAESADYLGSWFANDASASAAVDLIVVASAASIFMVVDGIRLGWARWIWVLVVLSFAIAIAFTFPLYLGLRELALRRRASGD